MKNKGKHAPKELCSVCNILIDHTGMEQHLKGKKHISLVNQIKMKKRISQQISSEGICITGNSKIPEKSLFCVKYFEIFFIHLKLGIPTSLRKDKLVKHFKQFGQVIAILRNETENTGLLQFRTKLVKFFTIINNLFVSMLNLDFDFNI